MNGIQLLCEGCGGATPGENSTCAVKHPSVHQVQRRSAFWRARQYAQTGTSDIRRALASDFVSGGELFTHLYQRDRFTEDEVRIYIGEIVLALEHLHKQRHAQLFLSNGPLSVPPLPADVSRRGAWEYQWLTHASRCCRHGGEPGTFSVSASGNVQDHLYNPEAQVTTIIDSSALCIL
ncbi:Ribosomal protein S6 kinase alpha-5 [Homalodisca vitripennis]|nr:Ribosomal protein S6 kinase alpha-5 [Homalodisca vitripennis]